MCGPKGRKWGLKERKGTKNKKGKRVLRAACLRPLTPFQDEYPHVLYMCQTSNRVVQSGSEPSISRLYGMHTLFDHLLYTLLFTETLLKIYDKLKLNQELIFQPSYHSIFIMPILWPAMIRAAKVMCSLVLFYRDIRTP